VERTACSIAMQLWKLGGRRSGLWPPPITSLQIPYARFWIGLFVEHAAYRDGMVEGNCSKRHRWQMLTIEAGGLCGRSREFGRDGAGLAPILPRVPRPKVRHSIVGQSREYVGMGRRDPRRG